MIADETRVMDQAKPPTRQFRSRDELDIREAVDAWGRARWPAARVVHELVMDRGTVRADMAFIEPDHIASIEIKSGYDGTDRLLQQVCLFRLATPETWVVTDPKHLRDVEMLGYLIPSLGIAVASRGIVNDGPFQITVKRPHSSFYVPQQEAMLSLLWVKELQDEAVRRGLGPVSKMTHAALVRRMLTLPLEEQLGSVCRALRSRNAMWRADPPIEPEPGA